VEEEQGARMQRFLPFGKRAVRGKGTMQTYLLRVGAWEEALHQHPAPLPRHPQELWQEEPVAHQLQPRKGKAGHTGGQEVQVEEELELLALRQEQLELLTQVVVVDLLDFLVLHFQEEMVELVVQA
jgi:hypothetical protein